MSISKLPKTIKIIIADDHDIFRRGLIELITKDQNYHIVGEVGDGQELIELLKEKDCHVVILDLAMPKITGLNALKRISKSHPKVKTIVLSSYSNESYIKQAFKHGAMAYLVKNDAFDQLIKAINHVLNGDKFVSPHTSKLLLSDLTGSDSGDESIKIDILTDREKQVLSLVVEGLTSKEIAKKLNISSRTVEAHRSNIQNKLNVDSLADLVKLAYAAGIID